MWIWEKAWGCVLETDSLDESEVWAGSWGPELSGDRDLMTAPSILTSPQHLPGH